MSILNILSIRIKFFGPLFKRGINRKHRKRNKKKTTNYKPYAWNMGTA